MAHWADYSTGERIQILRGAEVTQQQLAEMTGLSVHTIRAAEQDRRLTLPTLMLISDALGADISVIEGQQELPRAMAQDDRRMIRALSGAIHDTAAGILPPAEAVQHVELQRAIKRCWTLYWEGQYTEAGTVATRVIETAAATVHQAGVGAQAEAYGLLSDAYRLGAYVANLVGARDLAYAAIGHAQNAAGQCGDGMRPALVMSGRAWVYLRDARLGDALRLAERSATDIEPRFSTATPEQLTAYGSHINFAAVVASRMNNADRAADYLSVSHATGARMGREVRAHGTLFGPVSALTQAVGVNVSLGQTGKALTLINSVGDTSELTDAARNRFQMDKALALVDAKRYDRSLDVLEHALRAAPEWARHQTLPTVIAEKAGRASTAKLRRVSELLGVRAAGIGVGFSPATRRSAL
ncbi:helix-turn-helix transcriptional regulator [Streptomyces sp. NPDC102364]|uniref:helix-turn-helix transcriptional regulator n=1 Tax=Streptomyces sp. NPDC102364 TaxID=3366161 RepID=UPI003801981B